MRLFLYHAVNTMERCIVSKSVKSWIEGLGSDMVYYVWSGSRVSEQLCRRFSVTPCSREIRTWLNY